MAVRPAHTPIILHASVSLLKFICLQRVQIPCTNNNKHQSWLSATDPGKRSDGNSDLKPGGGGGGGSSSPRSQCKMSDDDMFPGWLLRETEFRQLSSADPSMLERRREDAATWIKQEVFMRQRGDDA